jgi:adenylate cyclase
MSRRFNGRWAVFAFALACGVLVGGRFWLPSPWLRAEAYLIDVYQRVFLDDAPETRIVVVDLDEASLAALGAWPWPRARLARLVEALLDEHRAAAVGLDLVLPEPGDAAGDRALGELARTRPLVLAQVFDLAGRSPSLRVGRLIPPSGAAGGDGSGAHSDVVRTSSAGASTSARWPQATGFIANHAGFAGARCAGHINYRPEADGQVRHLPPFVRWEGVDFPAFSIAMLQCAGALALSGASTADGGAPHGARSLRLPPLAPVPLTRDGDWRIPWTRAVGAFAVIPAAEVLDGSAPPDLLRGALVLVGSSSLGLSDLVGTPVSSALPGVMVHAQALSWLLDQLGQPPPPAWAAWLPWAWLLVTMALLGWMMSRGSAGVALAVLGGFALAWVWCAHLVLGAAWAERAMPPLVAYGVLFLVGAPVEWMFNQRVSRRLYLAFRDYLPQPVLDRLMRQDPAQAMAVTRRELTILFADIENSTAMAERLAPEALAEFTRGVLECMTRAIHASGGTLDKYIGDGVLAFWGAPLPVPDHADLALEAVQGIRRELAALNAVRAASGEPPVVVHVGVNSGEVVVGDLGTRFRRTYTVMGEAVNLAHRLQALSRDRRAFALVGDGTAARARRVALAPFDEVPLRGLTQPQQVFRLAEDA